MLAQRPQVPAGLPARRQPRLGAPRLGCRAAAGPQRRSAPAPKPQTPEPQLLAALETAAVALAVGGHAAALIAAHRHATEQQQHAGTARRGKQAAVGVASNGAAPRAPCPSWLAPGSVWLPLPLVAALALGRLRAWLASPLPKPGEAAVARLLRLEAAAGAQAEQLAVLAGQLDKLAVRSRVVGRDIKLPLHELQASAEQQAEALVGVVQRMERLERDIKDTEELVEALQGVSAKQFAVLLKVLEGQKATQQAAQAQPRGEGQKAPPPPRQQAPQRPAAAAPSRPASPPQTDAAQGSQGGGAAAGTDEWGRRVAPLPQAAAAEASPPPPRRPAADLPPAPPVPSAAPATAMSTSGADGGVLRPLGSPGGGGAASPDAPPPDAPSAAACDAEAAAAGGPRAAAAAGDDARKPGLGTESMLDILDSDPFFRAERELIATFVNQPSRVDKPEVEVLPPLWQQQQQQQQQPESPPESPAERRRRQQVEEWRQRLARSMQVTELASALGEPSGGAGAEQGGGGGEPAGGGGAATEQGGSELAGGGGAEMQQGGGEAGGAAPAADGPAAPPPAGPGSREGVSTEQNDDGSTTYRF